MDRNRPKARASRSLPINIRELIRDLDRQYPEPRVNPSDTMDEIKFRAGQRSVVLGLLDSLRAADERDPFDVPN